MQWSFKEKEFPRSSDPQVLAKYLYDKLDWDLTHAYQKLYVLYEKVEPGNTIPHQYKGQENLMSAINIIIEMKNKAGHNPSIKVEGTPTFDTLISKLSKVKFPTDITAELADELLAAAVASVITVEMNDPNMAELDAIQMARITVLQHFDNIIAEELNKK
jgi:hypothetical protein